MMEILTPVIIVSVIGLLAGIILAVAGKVFAVEVDENIEKVVEILPGANCGGCGYSGCEGYAAAVVKGEKTTLCGAGGPETAKKIAEILGVSAGEFVKTAAVVRCKGDKDSAVAKYEYMGLRSCAAAAQLDNGPSACRFGCIGLGDCVAVCEENAIRLVNGVAKVDTDACKACGRCAAVCPHAVIKILPVGKSAVTCKSNDKGAVTRKNCTAGCIGCSKCVKECPQHAITVTDFLAEIDSEKCNGCNKCAEVCPVKAISPIQ